jgi:hypothetical protein
MNRYSSYNCKITSRLLGALVAVFFCALLLRPATVFASIGQPVVKTIVVYGGGESAFGTDLNTSRAMGKLLQSSPVLAGVNVRKTAASYLSSHLGKSVAVYTWDQNRNGNVVPQSENTMLMRLDYSVWPQVIDGKSVVIGVIAVHVMRFLKQGFSCFDTHTDFLPVDSFVVADDPAQTQRNLESAIGRLLYGFGANIYINNKDE